MEPSPQITVAIPTYQGARHIAEALRGVLHQQATCYELLLSDDRSDDETLEIARAEAGDRLRIEVNSERLGLAGNWNRCVALCRTPLLAIFHQDDRMEPGHLAAHVDAFETNPTAGLVCNESTVIDELGREVSESVVERSRIAPANRSFGPGEFGSELIVRNPLRCSAVSMRTSAHAQAGGFDPHFRYVVDWDFWARVARDWSVIWLAHPTVSVRWHSASETHRFKAGITDLEEISELQNRLLEYRNDAAHWRGLVQRRLARAYLNRAHDSLGQGDSALARACLRRALQLDRGGTVATMGRDPRLAVSMAALVAAPTLTARWYRSRLGLDNPPVPTIQG